MSVTGEPQRELEAALARESELRAALVEAHRQRVETEDQLAEALKRADAEQVRRERLEQVLPLRVLKRLLDLPLLRSLRARRARDFERALSRSRGEGA